jgi:hypothetical protein
MSETVVREEEEDTAEAGDDDQKPAEAVHWVASARRRCG